jgi:hypothetical protein
MTRRFASGQTFKSGRFCIQRWVQMLFLAAVMIASGGVPVMAESPADRAALAALRPGAPVAEVAKAYGRVWKQPLPHREGSVLTIACTDGVVVRITTDGRLGSIRYDWRFGEEHSVAGIHMSADEDALRARFPNLDMKPFGAGTGPFSWPNLVESGLHMRFELGSTYEGVRYLRWIELYDPGAVYPPKQPVLYPAPSGAAGAPFKDVNLKLAVMSELIDNGHIDIGDPQDLYDHVLGRHFDLEEEGYEPVAEARAFLARFPLSQDLLDNVTSIEFDGSAEAYRYINYFWGGETDEFTILSFDGIEALRNLKSIRIISMVDETVDLAPLKQRGIEVR